MARYTIKNPQTKPNGHVIFATQRPYLRRDIRQYKTIQVQYKRETMKDFKDKTAVITGAGRGIALHCAKQGMKIVLADICLETLSNTEADLQALGDITCTYRIPEAISKNFRCYSET